MNNKFHAWAFQNFPFMEETFKEIDNYHLMMQILHYLREQLKDYRELVLKVDELENWFKNLDVQDEINNKLEEMVESGQLQEMITQYLEINGVLAFDTLDDLKNADNLANGSICRTLGTNTYNDSNGSFYKIRTITSDDIVDNIDIVSLTNYPTLIAERIKSYEKKLVNKMFNKFTGNKYAYNRLLNYSGNIFSISPNRFYSSNNTSQSIQGIAYDKLRERIICVNGTQIYTIEKNALVDNITVLYTDDYGHAGDCAIVGDYIYISDSESNSIYKVNLLDGTKVNISIDINKIKGNFTNPILGGICFDNDDSYCYIALINEVNDTSQVASGENVKIIKFDLDSKYSELFSEHLDLHFVQGLTCDNDGFYIVGNKPFTSSYTGSYLYIINKYTLDIVDRLYNSESRENEGIDYCCINGMEGLLTEYGSHGSHFDVIMLCYYGKTLCDMQITKNWGNGITGDIRIVWNGYSVMLTGKIDGLNLAHSQTAILDHLTDNRLDLRFPTPSIPYVQYTTAQARNVEAIVIYKNDDSLSILTADGNPQNLTSITFNIALMAYVI